MPALNVPAPQIDWAQVARLTITSRTIDTIEENELVPAGKIAYQFSAKGHELAQVLLGLNLSHPKDAAGVYYRSRPFMLASGLTIEEAMAGSFAKSGSLSEGRDVGVMYAMAPRTGATVLPASGDVGAQYTPAAGWAQAIQYHQHILEDTAWEGAIAAALGGDGSVASNGFWSALTIATTLKLPYLFFIEDNGYGISVPSKFQTPGSNIAENLASFGNLHILEGSGTSPQEAADLIGQAVRYVRAGQGPCLLRLKVVRLMGHTYGEDQTAYKSEDLLSVERGLDPYDQLKDFLADKLDWAALEKEVEIEIRDGIAAALTHPDPDPQQAHRHLFYSGQPTQVPPQSTALAELPQSQPRQDGPRVNFSEALRTTIESELNANPRLLVFGEDVGPRGGVHRVTVGLQSEFGEERVFDTSLSEEGIVGRSLGLALAGLRPLAEIQFRKYADPATEQINGIGWVRWETAGKFGAPVVVRMPVGHSKKTGDPWHSVSGEAVYAHTLGWQIAYPSNAQDAAGLLRTALRSPNPTLFLEHRALLDALPARRPYPGEAYSLPFGKAAVVQEGKLLTVVTWGEMVYRCLEAAQPFGQAVEIIDLRTIIPWDKAAVLASIKKTGKGMVVHEDTATGGFGGEIIATLADEAFIYLDAPLKRLATIDTPIPYNKKMMEQAVIPSVGVLRQEMDALLKW